MGDLHGRGADQGPHEHRQVRLQNFASLKTCSIAGHEVVDLSLALVIPVQCRVLNQPTQAQCLLCTLPCSEHVVDARSLLWCSVPDECPEEVVQLIDACMLEDPEQRPSALDIIQAITAIPVTQRPQPQRPWYAR